MGKTLRKMQLEKSPSMHNCVSDNLQALLQEGKQKNVTFDEEMVDGEERVESPDFPRSNSD